MFIESPFNSISDTVREIDLIPYQCAENLPAGKILVLAPHPDDEVFGCGGAIMRHLAQGDTVNVLIVTDGCAAAAHQNEQEKQAYIALRREESRCAARVLGYGETDFWNLPDRELSLQNDLPERLLAYIQSVGADLVYAPSMNELHPDHYALGAAAAAAARNLKGRSLRVAFYEIGAFCGPNLLLDISPYLERKEQAAACFPSQFELHAYSKYLRGLEHYRTYTLPAEVEAAEAYYFTDAVELRAYPARAFGSSRHSLYSEQLLHELSNVRTQLAECRYALDEMRRSKSWRITAPLRALRRFFSGLSA